MRTSRDVVECLADTVGLVPPLCCAHMLNISSPSVSARHTQTVYVCVPALSCVPGAQHIVALSATSALVHKQQVTSPFRTLPCNHLNGTRMLAVAFDPVRPHRAYVINDAGQLLLLSVPHETKVTSCRVSDRQRHTPYQIPYEGRGRGVRAREGGEGGSGGSGAGRSCTLPHRSSFSHMTSSTQLGPLGPLRSGCAVPRTT